MKIIEVEKLNRDQISNINELEEVINGTITNLNMIKMDLKNGRYANIIAYLDSTRDMVTVSIQEIGMLTKKIFIEDVYYTYEGDYGIQITSDQCIDEEFQTREMFDVYNKYKQVIDELILITFIAN